MTMTALQHPVVILAGGQSRRMNGPDKATLRIGASRLIDIVVSKVNNQAGTVYISGPHNYGLDIESIPDRMQSPKGPAGGLYAATQKFLGTTEGFFTVPVDGPNIPEDLCHRLYARTSSSLASDGDRLHPVYAWWRLEDLARFWDKTDATESISVKFLAQNIRAKTVVWNNATGEGLFFNINSKADLQDYLEHGSSSVK